MNDSKLAKVFNMFEQTCWIPTTVFWPQPWFSVQRVHFNSHLKLQSFELGEPPIPPSWKNCPPMLLWVPNMWGRGSKEAPVLSTWGDGNCNMLAMCQVWKLTQFYSLCFLAKYMIDFWLALQANQSLFSFIHSSNFLFSAHWKTFELTQLSSRTINLAP